MSRSQGPGSGALQGCIWVVVKIKVPFWGTLSNRCRIIIGTQKGTIILTTTHMALVFGLQGSTIRGSLGSVSLKQGCWSPYILMNNIETSI